MKKLLTTAACISFSVIAMAQTNSNSSKSNNVYVRETMDFTTASSNYKISQGLVLLGTSQSGYKIYMNKVAGKPEVVVKDPKGNTVPTGRRKYIHTTSGLVCQECTMIRENGADREVCYEVICTDSDKIKAELQRTQ